MPGHPVRPRRALVTALCVLAFEVVVVSLAARVKLGPLPLVLANAILVGFAIIVIDDRETPVLEALGFDAPAPRGIAAGLAMSLPMVTALALTRDVVTPFPWAHFVRAALATALAEEIVFRGYAFRRLTRGAGIGLVKAAVVTAVAFAVARVAAAAASGETRLPSLAWVGAFGFVVGVGFAALAAAWNGLWVPLALHFALNFAWSAFAGSLVDVHDPWAHVGRLATFVLAIAMTLVLCRRRAPKAAVNEA